MTDKPSKSETPSNATEGSKQAPTLHACVENAYENTTDFLPEIVVTDEMVEAGAEAISRWYGEPGEPVEFSHRAAQEVWEAMMEVHALRLGRKSF